MKVLFQIAVLFVFAQSAAAAGGHATTVDVLDNANDPKFSISLQTSPIDTIDQMVERIIKGILSIRMGESCSTGEVELIMEHMKATLSLCEKLEKANADLVKQKDAALRGANLIRQRVQAKLCKLKGEREGSESSEGGSVKLPQTDCDEGSSDDSTDAITNIGREEIAALVSKSYKELEELVMLIRRARGYIPTIQQLYNKNCSNMLKQAIENFGGAIEVYGDIKELHEHILNVSESMGGYFNDFTASVATQEVSASQELGSSSLNKINQVTRQGNPIPDDMLNTLNLLRQKAYQYWFGSQNLDIQSANENYTKWYNDFCILFQEGRGLMTDTLCRYLGETTRNMAKWFVTHRRDYDGFGTKGNYLCSTQSGLRDCEDLIDVLATAVKIDYNTCVTVHFHGQDCSKPDLLRDERKETLKAILDNMHVMRIIYSNHYEKFLVHSENVPHLAIVQDSRAFDTVLEYVQNHSREPGKVPGCIILDAVKLNIKRAGYFGQYKHALREIHLIACGIKEWSQDDENVGSLDLVDVSWNKLDSLPPPRLMNGVKCLVMDGNNLYKVKSSDLEGIVYPTIKKLSIAYNGLHTEHPIVLNLHMIFPNLNALFIRGNHLTTLNLQDFGEFAYLDFGGPDKTVVTNVFLPQIITNGIAAHNRMHISDPVIPNSKWGTLCVQQLSTCMKVVHANKEPKCQDLRFDPNLHGPLFCSN